MEPSQLAYNVMLAFKCFSNVYDHLLSGYYHSIDCKIRLLRDLHGV